MTTPSTTGLEAPGSSLRSIVQTAERATWAGPGILVTGYVFWRFLQSLMPGLGDHDFAEMQVTAWRLGVPHGSGYPLYIWLGHLFDHLPVGTPAYRLNLFSSVCGALAVWVGYLIVLRVTTRGVMSQMAAAAAMLAFGSSFTLWSISIFAQMYSLQVLLTLVVVWLGVRWLQDGQSYWLWLTLFSYGCMFGNHVCTVAVAPGLALFLLATRSRQWLNWRSLWAAGSSFVLGFLCGNILLFWLLWKRHAPWDQYHSVILANPDLFPFPGGRDSFWACWWFNATTDQFRWAMNPDTHYMAAQARAIPHRLVAELFPLGALGAGVGLILLWKRQWRIALLLSGIVVTQSLLNLHYDNWKVPFYFVVPYACAAVCLGAAVGDFGNLLWKAAQPWIRESNSTYRAASVISLFCFVLITLGLANRELAQWYRDQLPGWDGESARLVAEKFGPRPDLSQETRVHEQAAKLLDFIPDGSLIFAEWWIMYPLEYVAVIEGKRPGVTILEAYPSPRGWGFSERKQKFIAEQMKGRPVYIAGNPGGASGPYVVREVTPGLARFDRE